MSKKILIADDDPAIVDALQVMLEMEDYEVICSVDGAAIEDAEDESPDLILLDMWMPGMDGEEVCKRLKKNDRTKQIPIVTFSASKNMRKVAMKAGADEFIEKPFDMEELIELIEGYIK